MNLYRTISLETFIDIIHSKRERYVRPATWEDTFEGYLYSKLYDKEECRRIINEIYYNVCPRNYRATIDNILKLEHSKWFVYGQSWSSVTESDAMWRIYSYNRHSIQIKTTDIRLCNILSKANEIDFVIGGIKYDVDPQDNLMHMQIEQLKNTKSIYEPFLHKRKAFKHEAEKRVLIYDRSWIDMLGMKSMGTNWKIDECVEGMSEMQILDEIEHRLCSSMKHINEKKIPNNYYVTIPDLKKYISGVRVNPFAEEWYVELIRNLCKEYDIHFNGQSELYEKFSDK